MVYGSQFTVHGKGSRAFVKETHGFIRVEFHASAPRGLPSLRPYLKGKGIQGHCCCNVMRTYRPHPWNVSPEEAREIQQWLKKHVVCEDRVSEIRLIAGVDVAYSKAKEKAYAVAVLLAFPSLEIIEEAIAGAPVTFPYIPGLLSFREGPVALKALKNLKKGPDIILFDGHGIAHPAGLGLASHLGLLLDIPSIGCAKSPLVGEFCQEGLGYEKGSWVPLMEKGETVGAALRTREGVKPIIVSPGHRICIKSAIKVVLACSGKYRIPEPLRQAHLRVRRLPPDKSGAS